MYITHSSYKSKQFNESLDGGKIKIFIDVTCYIIKIFNFDFYWQHIFVLKIWSVILWIIFLSFNIWWILCQLCSYHDKLGKRTWLQRILLLNILKMNKRIYFPNTCFGILLIYLGNVSINQFSKNRLVWVNYDFHMNICSSQYSMP